MLRDLTSMGPKSRERMLGIRTAGQAYRQKILEEKQHQEKQAKTHDSKKEPEAKKVQFNLESSWIKQAHFSRDHEEISYIHSCYSTRVIEAIAIREDNCSQIMLELMFDKHTKMYQSVRYQTAKAILNSYELLVEHEDYYSRIAVQDLKSLNSALSAIIQIENSVQMLEEKIRNRIAPLVKHKVTLKNWMKEGYIVNSSDSDVDKYLTYKNLMPTKFNSITLKHLPNYCCLTLEGNISLEGLESLKSTIGEGIAPGAKCRFDIAILGVGRLILILEKLQNVDRSIAYISEDLIHSYDPNYANERKWAIVSGLYCKQGKTPSTIFKVFNRNNNTADPKIFCNIFSFLFVPAPNQKITASKITPKPKKVQQEGCIIS